MRQRKTIFHIVFCICFICSCAQVPLTNRRSLNLLPESQMLALSLEQYGKVINEANRSRNREDTELVKRVGKRIAGAAERFMNDSGLQENLKNYKWEFTLIEDDKTANAWCMPGGKVAVYSGIFKYTKDENGLAVVIGHEVAHAIARHGNERMSQGLIASMGGIALSVALSEKPSRTRNLFMTAYGVGSSLAVLLPYSRLHEYEADRIGLTLMAMAGYDPRKAVSFWNRMEGQKEKDRPPEYLSTHPAPESRIAHINYYIREALPYYRR